MCAIKTIKSLVSFHYNANKKIYITIVSITFLGVVFGILSFKALEEQKILEIRDFLDSFINLFEFKNLEFSEVLKLSFSKNFKILILLSLLGVSIIGMPFIAILCFLRGYMVGFSIISCFLIDSLSFSLAALAVIIIKEIFILAGIWAVSVNGVNFSFNIIRRFSNKVRNLKANSLKIEVAKYMLSNTIFSFLVLIGVLCEAYLAPLIMITVKSN